jgi:hypothetical protein
MPTTVMGRRDDSIVSPLSGEAVFCSHKADASGEGAARPGTNCIRAFGAGGSKPPLLMGVRALEMLE